MQPTGERRAVLQASKDFLCDCPRCSAKGDDTRRFPCCSLTAAEADCLDGSDATTVTKCNGHHLATQLQLEVDPTSEVAVAVALLLPCSACGTAASVVYAAHVVEQEAVFCKQVAVIKYLLSRGGARSAAAASVLRLKPSHPHHAHTAEVGYLMWALGGGGSGSGGGEKRASAVMLQAALASRNVILPHASHDDAFRHELLGDALMAEAGGGNIEGALPCWQLTAAHEAYCNAVRSLVLLSGVSHPYSLDACEKLLGAQRSMPSRDDPALVNNELSCCFCGGGRLDGLPMEVCGSCGWARYCCGEHLKLQMPLHKLCCKRGASAAADEIGI